MMTIQKPKRTWQKKKDYMRKKTIRGLRRKGKRILQSFDDGTDDNIRKQIEKDFPSSKAFGTILPDYTIIADPTFTRDKTGAGEIEYFNEPEITYANGYKKANPVKGPSLVYNPNSQTEEDIKLDLLHHYREYDPVYQDLLKDYTNTQDPGQILYNSELGEYFRNLPKEQQTNENWNKLVKENLNGQYMVQGIDGSLRGLMASDKLRSSGRYPSRTVYEQENLNTDAARKAYQNIVNYLTSERLPEVIVKPGYNKGKDKKNNNQNWFTKMAIGAAFNENPAVMTASGWHKDSRGNWKQKRTATTDKLADNLEAISMAADGTGGIEAVKSMGKLLWNVVRHPERTLKQVKTLGGLAKNATVKGTKYIKRAVNKVVKQVTAKKRINHTLKQARNTRVLLNQRITDYYNKSEKVKDQIFDRRKIFKGKRVTTHKPYNWEKMTVDQAKKAATKATGKPVDFTERKAVIRTQYLDKNGKPVTIEEERNVPTIRTAGSSDSVTKGEYQTPDFQTGSTIKGDLKINERGRAIYPPSHVDENGNYTYVIPTEQETNFAPRVVTGDKPLRDVLSKNIKYLENEIPGFKPFGSSVGVSENALTHNTHDIDGYITRKILDELKKKGLVIETAPGETYLYKVQGGKFGEAGNVDLNILNIGEDGRIGNSRTAEMYRQFFPLEYQKQARELAGSRSASGDFSNLRALDANGNILTEEQLLDSYDPIVKTIMDSGEIDFTNPNKAKHAKRFLEYLAGDNQEAVHRALDLESKRAGSLGHLLPKMNFHSPEENVKLLQKIGFTGDIGTVASDPNKMQNVLDYWYLSARRNYRAVNAGDYTGGGESVEHLMRNLTDWNASGVNSGGSVSGFGLNTTIDGPSGVPRTIDGYIQPYIEGLDTMTDPNAVIDAVNRSYGIGLSNEIKSEIASRFGVPFISTGVENSQDLLTQLPHSGEATKSILQKIAQDYKINSFTGRSYGSNIGSLYSGIARTLDPNKDAIGTMLSLDANRTIGTATYPSWSQRMGDANVAHWKLPQTQYMTKIVGGSEDPLQTVVDRFERLADRLVRADSRYYDRIVNLKNQQNKINNRIFNTSMGTLVGGFLGGSGYLLHNAIENDRAVENAKKAQEDYIQTLNNTLTKQSNKLNTNWYPIIQGIMQNDSINDAIKQGDGYLLQFQKPLRDSYQSEYGQYYHNSGKDIHIKKANRGKFTEAANEHNMGVQEFARQVLSAPKGKYSSTLRKRANFARNFAH